MLAFILHCVDSLLKLTAMFEKMNQQFTSVCADNAYEECLFCMGTYDVVIVIKIGSTFMGFSAQLMQVGKGSGVEY